MSLPHHWVLESFTLSDPKVIALVYFEQSDYAVYLHPFDKRGYRSLVRLIDNHRMAATINRNYTSSERIGLALTMALVTEAYTRIVPIAQNAVLGNNAHSLDPETGITQLGTREEPIFLHGHVFGRGNPKKKYIENVPLDGPSPGVVFDLRTQSSHEPGNDKKIDWKSDETISVVARLRAEMENIQGVYKTHGLTTITQHISFDIYIVRHGETDWNLARKIQGHTDNPLNEQGTLQACQLQEKFGNLNFAKTFSSDLSRARSTAELILGQSSITGTSPLLRERNMGVWEGRLADELRSHLKQTSDIDNLTKEEYISFKWDDTVESYSDVYERIQTFIRSIVISASMSDDPVLLLSHGGVIRAILYHLDFQFARRWQVSNCAFLKLRIQTDGQIHIEASEGVKLIDAKDTILSF